MRNTGRIFRIALPLAIIALTGCEETSGPGSLDTLNTQAALADYSAIDAVRKSAGWQGFQMAAPSMEAAGFGAAPAGVAMNAIPLISDANRGKTFVYDAALRNWVIDPTRTDAPANGVRFITYESRGAEPDPSRPIGHADLIDLGDATAGIALRLVVVEGSLTIVNYKVTLEGNDGGGHVTVAGFIQDARDRLDFDIGVHGQKSGSVESADISFDLAIAAREFRAAGNIDVKKQNGAESGHVDMLVRHGPSSFNVDIENEQGTLDGAIDLNDSPFAIVSGPAEKPIFRKPNGGEIGGDDALVLWRIADISEDVFDLFEDLVDPIDELVIWAAIL